MNQTKDVARSAASDGLPWYVAPPLSWTILAVVVINLLVICAASIGSKKRYDSLESRLEVIEKIVLAVEGSQKDE